MWIIGQGPPCGPSCLSSTGAGLGQRRTGKTGTKDPDKCQARARNEPGTSQTQVGHTAPQAPAHVFFLRAAARGNWRVSLSHIQNTPGCSCFHNSHPPTHPNCLVCARLWQPGVAPESCLPRHQPIDSLPLLPTTHTQPFSLNVTLHRDSVVERPIGHTGVPFRCPSP